MSKKRICGKGFLVSQSKTDGKYVPFFIKVRDKDIIYKESNLIDAIEARSASRTGSNVDVLYPAVQWMFDKDNFKIAMNRDASFTGYARLSIKDLIKSSSNTKLKLQINLPFTVKSESFNIQITANSNKDEIAGSSISINSIGAGSLDNVNVTMTNNINFFSNTSNDYINDYIFVNIYGVLS